jgi:hypothetical protein
MDAPTLGRIAILVGALFLIVGVLLVVSPRVPLLRSLGHLPGDIFIQRGSVRIAIPIVTSILISLILTILLNILFRR